MLSVIHAECHMQAHYAERLYAECRYARCRYAKGRDAYLENDRNATVRSLRK